MLVGTPRSLYLSHFSSDLQTQAASDALDPQLSAPLFQLVCKYAIGLDLHNTDNPNSPSGFGQDNIDEARRGFWELMHYEFFHRLVPTMRFILKSRLTFILAEFFMLLKNISGRLEGESLAQVLALCQQIDDLYKDWYIDT
ncbi:fungal specific transcription factor factor [Fusarium globosum]|uniref:Fungal specific transcription factor factor n=1 Tax=Fusarium globosum TaxID=78864 RepID=A0A8H5YSJ1_9HYPO|nr:fungal specific transcription factor factor [Fusarium globosum]